MSPGILRVLEPEPTWSNRRQRRTDYGRSVWPRELVFMPLSGRCLEPVAGSRRFGKAVSFVPVPSLTEPFEPSKRHRDRLSICHIDDPGSDGSRALAFPSSRRTGGRRGPFLTTPGGQFFMSPDVLSVPRRPCISNRLPRSRAPDNIQDAGGEILASENIGCPGNIGCIKISISAQGRLWDLRVTQQ